jgi:hypothetical protein
MPREAPWRDVIKSIVADKIKAEKLRCSAGATCRPTTPRSARL